jgi:PKHD-type hydroxylase
MITMLTQLLQDTEVQRIRAALANGRFVPGETSAGSLVKAGKHNLQLDRTSIAANDLDLVILTALERNMLFHSVALARQLRPFLYNRHDVGMTYGEHVDNPLMGKPAMRTDMSMTVFLSDPESYDGGELFLRTPYGDKTVKGKAGDAVIYPTTLVHQVNPVTRGTRLAAVTWIESHVRDAACREILHDLNVAHRAVAAKSPDSDEAQLLSKSYTNLLKM